MENDPHAQHASNFERKLCPKHNPDGHWQDDYAYMDEDREVATAAGEMNTKDDLLKCLAKSLPDDVSIYRFSLVLTKADTGLIDVLGNPGCTPDTIINLLSQAIGLIAHQQSVQKVMASAQVTEALSNMLGTHEINLDTILDGINPTDLGDMFN